MRFDDSLKTVLAADTSTSLGARAVFRQLADLIARGRAPADGVLLARLAELRDAVPLSTRASVARGMALSDPPASLVAIFADDHPDVSGAVLRAARLAPDDWEALIPTLSPLGRSILRRRDDLPPSATRALQSLGSTDFALSDDRAIVPAAFVEPPAPRMDEEPLHAPDDLAAPVAASFETPAQHNGGRFEIAELVSRIEEYQRDRANAAPTPAATDAPVVSFRFETDTGGVIRWIDSAPRGAVIGLSLSHAGGGNASVDGVAAGAYRKRAPFTDARLVVGGASALAGNWRIAGMPIFEQATGRFMGYRGTARRPRIEEEAAHTRAAVDAGGGVEGLRRLVHELRTPTNAIAGFSELIENELLGPVAPVYRERAASIRDHVTGLIGAIEDLDLAARMESSALDLRPDAVALRPLLARFAEEFAPLAERRGATLSFADTRIGVRADSVALERLIARLLASVLSLSEAGEHVRLDVAQIGEMVELSLDRPARLGSDSDATPLGHDQAGEDDAAPLLGIGFALRLVRNLCAELGGRFTIDAARLTVTLPAAFNPQMETANTVVP